MELSAGDLPKLVGHFYEAAANPDIWPDVLDAFARTFGSRGVFLPTLSCIPGTVPHSRGLTDVIDQFFSEGWHQHEMHTPPPPKPAPRPVGFVADQSPFSAGDVEMSEHYRSFARSAGVPWFSAAILATEPNADYIAISLQRTDREGPFTASEMASLNVILPQLRNAASLARSLTALRGQSLVDGLEMGGEPAILVNEHGVVRSINRLAQKVLGDGLSIRRGRLTAERSSDNAALSAMIAAACAPLEAAGTAPALPIVIASTSGHAPIVARVAPIHRSGGDVFGFSGAMIMLTQLGTSLAVPEDLLRNLFGLTRREAQIMSLVGEGMPLERIALTLNVSREAVRFHLKAVFSKTNTHRQGELVAIHAHLGGLAR